MLDSGFTTIGVVKRTLYSQKKKWSGVKVLSKERTSHKWL